MARLLAVALALLLLGLGGWFWAASHTTGHTEQPQTVEAVTAQAEQPQSPVPAHAPDTLIEPEDENAGTPQCIGDAPDVPKAPPPPYPLSGRLGLWVAEIDPQTLKPVRAVGSNPNSLFPLASTYKQAVLWAVLREFDAGRISPTTRFDVTPQNQSLGEYPYDGTNVRALTERMMRESDNTATDMLHREVGLNTVQALADDLRLCQTRVILPTKDWWVMQSGLSKTFAEHPDWWQREDRLKLAQRIDTESQDVGVYQLVPVLDKYFETLHQPADDLSAHNFSTPYEFSTLLAHQYLQPHLSERATRWQAEVARLGYGKSGLRAAQVGNVETFYGKGGNGWRLLTYTGYFETKDGHHVVYAFMQHGANEWYTMPNTYRAFAWINAAVDEVIGEQKKPKPLPKLYLAPPLQANKSRNAPSFSVGAKLSDFARP